MARGAGAGTEPVQLGPLTVGRRSARVLRGLVTAGTLLALVVLTLLMSAGVLTDRNFYERSLGDARAYDRFYTQILADRQFNEVTDNLVPDLPIDKSLITSNLRVVIPPATLRALVGSTIQSLVDYLSAERDDIDLGVAAEPLVNNVKQLAEHYLTDAIVNTESFQAQNLGQFGDSVVRFFDDIEAGRQPDLLPSIPLTPDTSDSVARIISANIPKSSRAETEPRIAAALSVGDLNGAMALAAIQHVQIGEKKSTQLLTLEIGDDGQVNFTASVDAMEDTTVASVMQRARFVLGTVYPFAMLGLVLVVAGGLALIAFITGRLGGARMRRVGYVIVAGGVIAGVVWGIAWLLAPDPLEPMLSSSNTSMAPSVRGVLGDTWDDARGELNRTFLTTAFQLAFVGVGVVVLSWLLPRLVRLWRDDRRRFWTVSTGIAAFLVIVLFVNVTITLGATDASATRRCNGHAELCDRSYADVTYAGSHNAMANADRGYISAMQDLTMGNQLEQGVRALLIDAHYWEGPEQTQAFLASVPTSTADALRPLLAGANPQRPGGWWCHVLCRLGAQQLTRGLEEIATFVKRHPDEVVTLVIEDYVSRADIRKTVRDSGLSKYVFTPDDDPSFEWPTLGEMIDDGTRIVIFSEKDKKLAAPNYYRQFYRYGMETPFDHKAPTQAEMSCEENRGGSDKELFLMNHWITRATGSRADAGIVNEKRFILERARRCERQRDHKVNIVAVDFTTIGDLFAAVNVLNGVDSR